MRVMVVGGGGREHALAWKLAQSRMIGDDGALLCVPGNPGMAALGECHAAPGARLSDAAALAEAARASRAEFVVVGPELPLTHGLVDELSARGIPSFGASRSAARLEGSKAFAKQFMARHGIPTPAFDLFDDVDQAIRFLSAPGRKFPLVVKADGLAAGKGVVIAADFPQAEEAVTSMLVERRFGAAGERVVIEACAEGTEASFFALTDGEHAVGLATAQDFKRALDGDAGPNTGGMGALSPSVEFDASLADAVMANVVRPTIRGMALEGAPYRGVLYAGLMLTASGPVVLEFNARFGDPETQVLMPRLDCDLLPLMLAASGAHGRLQEAAGAIRWSGKWAACVVVASRGYPGPSESGRRIEGLDRAGAMPDTMVFHAATSAAGAGGVQTAGGRVLAVTALGASLTEAARRAYEATSCIRFEGMQYRRDIGRAAAERLARTRETDWTGGGGAAPPA